MEKGDFLDWSINGVLALVRECNFNGIFNLLRIETVDMQINCVSPKMEHSGACSLHAWQMNL